MARQGNQNMDGACRVVQEPPDPGASFVPGSNNGAFASIAGDGAGEVTLTMDAEQLLSAGDVVEAQIEEGAPGGATVERVSPSTIIVRTYDAAGALASLPFNVTVTGRHYV